MPSDSGVDGGGACLLDTLGEQDDFCECGTVGYQVKHR